MKRLAYAVIAVLAATGCADSEAAGGSGGAATQSTGATFSAATFAGPGTGTSTASGDMCGSTLPAVVRDFHATHPDFEAFLGDDPDIVAPDLGSEGKPVYAGNPTTPTTTGKTNFDQWYRDTPGVNTTAEIGLALVDAGGGVWTYDNSAYFPLDGQGFGDEGNPHNFHFTTEVHTAFTYKGGEVFTFTGDDDLFAYINGKLVIDLGGVHGAETKSVDLDQVAGQIGIVPGGIYPLDLFGAERHTSESNFRIDTTIACFAPPPQ